MKKIITNTFMISALLIGISSTNSCNKVDDIIDDVTIPIPFSIPVTIETEIPFLITTEYERLPAIPLDLNLDEEIEKKFPSLSVDNLKSAKLSTFSIDYISSTNNIKLDKVKNARLILRTPKVTEEIVIANVENNISDSALNFTPVADLELLDYLKSNDASLILEMQGTEVALDQMKIRINSAFKIQVGL